MNSELCYRVRELGGELPICLAYIDEIESAALLEASDFVFAVLAVAHGEAFCVLFSILVNHINFNRCERVETNVELIYLVVCECDWRIGSLVQRLAINEWAQNGQVECAVEREVRTVHNLKVGIQQIKLSGTVNYCIHWKLRN